ncbi:MAG: flagellar FlbD family protein [Lachnospiraceae bacterium]|nr:flagellar FlbD family protein [Lachnospiraceae bacterium]
MITLTKLNDEQFVLNAELIKTVEKTPDTVITLTTGNKYIVKESVEKVVDEVISYKKEIFSQLIK